MTDTLLDSLNNEIYDSETFMNELFELLGRFQVQRGCAIEGKLFVGTTLVWNQRVARPDEYLSPLSDGDLPPNLLDTVDPNDVGQF